MPDDGPGQAPIATHGQGGGGRPQQADHHRGHPDPEQHMAGVLGGEEPFPTGPRRVGAVEDGVPGQAGEEEQHPEEPEGEEGTQSLGHGDLRGECPGTAKI